MSGGGKRVIVATRVKGLDLLEFTEFDIKRPTVELAPLKDDIRSMVIFAPAPLDGAAPTSWQTTVRMVAAPTVKRNVEGDLAWCQTITGLSINRQGNDGENIYQYPSPLNPKLALDQQFPYDTYPPNFLDTPAVGSAVQLSKTGRFKGNFQLYMMYLHARKKPRASRWVPLAVMKWELNIGVSRVGAGGGGLANYNEIPPKVFIMDEKSQDTTDTPDWEWKAVIPKKEKYP